MSDNIASYAGQDVNIISILILSKLYSLTLLDSRQQLHGTHSPRRVAKSSH